MKMLKSAGFLLLLCAIFITLAACDTPDTPSDETVPYAFALNGLEIRVDDKMAAVAEVLGAPLSYSELGTCGLRGDMDKVYAYSDVFFYTAQINGVDYIDSIVLKTDLVSTKEGVAIGDTKADVLTAYGEPSETKGKALVYTAGSMQLVFHLDDAEAVHSIVYQFPTKN